MAVVMGGGVAAASGGGGEPPRAGVIVETTAGPDAGAVRAGRAEVARLRAAGFDAELRVTRSPSESLAAAATLVTRGAATLHTFAVDEDAALRPLAERRPGVRLVRR